MIYFSFSPVTDVQEKQDKHAMTFPTQAVILSLKQPAALSQQLYLQTSHNYTLP